MVMPHPVTAGLSTPPIPQRMLALYRNRAAHYDLELTGFEMLRQACIARLDLQPGERVLDMGCGTGLSLPTLARLVGPEGRVLGVDQSAAMLAQARERVKREGLTQVRLKQAAAAEAPLHGRYDAALFVFTHDILQQPEALAHIAAHLKPGARIAATGLAWAQPWAPWALASNCFVMGAALYSVASLQGLGEPWQLLRGIAPDLQLLPQLPGGFYLAWGHYAGG